MPVTAPGRFLGRRLRYASGGFAGAIAYAADEGNIVFTSLDAVLTVGEKVLIHRHEGHWVARRHGPPQPPPGDWHVCAAVLTCVGEHLAGATVTVTQGETLIGTCETTISEVTGHARCCVVVPAAGVYLVTASHPDHGTTSREFVASSGPPGPYGDGVLCLPHESYGRVCIGAGGCGGAFVSPGALAVQFLQGGMLVAEVPVNPYVGPGLAANGRACACLPAKVATTMRAVNPPSRYVATAGVTIPAYLVPACGSTLPFVPFPFMDLLLRPAPGYACVPCWVGDGCEYPVSDTLYLTDPLTGHEVVITRSGTAWTGTDVAAYPGCPYGCPPDDVDIIYTLTKRPWNNPFVTPPSRCLITRSVRHSYKLVSLVEGLPPVYLWCPGNTTAPGAVSRFELHDQVVAEPLACPPGYVVTGPGFTRGWCGPVDPFTVTITE